MKEAKGKTGCFLAEKIPCELNNPKLPTNSEQTVLKADKSSAGSFLCLSELKQQNTVEVLFCFQKLKTQTRGSIT